MDNHGKKRGDTMELLLKRMEKPSALGTRYDLFAKLELNEEELALIRKAKPDKTIIIVDEIGRNYFRWILMLIPAFLAAIIVGAIVGFLTNGILGVLVGIFTILPFRRLLFKQVSGDVSVGDIITGRTIHCKSFDELLVKEDDIRKKITRYCKNLEAMHSLGNEQRIKLN
jgi:hypothetical protein